MAQRLKGIMAKMFSIDRYAFTPLRLYTFTPLRLYASAPLRLYTFTPLITPRFPEQYIPPRFPEITKISIERMYVK
jgi:hypothetical protein